MRVPRSAARRPRRRGGSAASPATRLTWHPPTTVVRPIATVRQPGRAGRATADGERHDRARDRYPFTADPACDARRACRTVDVNQLMRLAGPPARAPGSPRARGTRRSARPWPRARPAGRARARRTPSPRRCTESRARVRRQPPTVPAVDRDRAGEQALAGRRADEVDAQVLVGRRSARRRSGGAGRGGEPAARPRRARTRASRRRRGSVSSAGSTREIASRAPVSVSPDHQAKSRAVRRAVAAEVAPRQLGQRLVAARAAEPARRAVVEQRVGVLLAAARAAADQRARARRRTSDVAEPQRRRPRSPRRERRDRAPCGSAARRSASARAEHAVARASSVASSSSELAIRSSAIAAWTRGAGERAAASGCRPAATKCQVGRSTCVRRISPAAKAALDVGVGRRAAAPARPATT